MTTTCSRCSVLCNMYIYAQSEVLVKVGCCMTATDGWQSKYTLVYSAVALSHGGDACMHRYI